MVKSAYYSQLPTIRCRDCGQMITFAEEHYCYARPAPMPDLDEELHRVRNPKPYAANPYANDYDRNSYRNDSRFPGEMNGYGYEADYGAENYDRGREGGRRGKSDGGKREKSRHRDPSASSRSSRRDRDPSQHRDKSRTRQGERDRARERQRNPELTDLRTNGLTQRSHASDAQSATSSGLASSIDAVMADLMNEMSVDERTGREGKLVKDAIIEQRKPKKRPACGGCGRRITDPSQAFRIDVLQRFFHVSCFRCCMCGSFFDENNPYIPHEGRAYCEADFSEVMSQVCGGCNQPVESSPVYALGKIWHEEHLQCDVCRQPIRGNPFEQDDKVYCAADYAALVAPRCAECSDPIQGETICALNKTFHVECFVCKTCKSPFPDKSFYVYGDDPLCRIHYHERNNSLCGSCSEPIEGPCAEVMELDARFHPECWACTLCRVPLTSTYYSFANRPYCEVDIMRVYKQEKANNRYEKMNKRQTLMRNL